MFAAVKKSLQVRHSGPGRSRDKGRELPKQVLLKAGGPLDGCKPSEGDALHGDCYQSYLWFGRPYCIPWRAIQLCHLPQETSQEAVLGRQNHAVEHLDDVGPQNQHAELQNSARVQDMA